MVRGLERLMPLLGCSRLTADLAPSCLGLGLTNLNAFGLVPIQCFLNDSFYNKAILLR
jgi:hypothetical protein